MKSAVADAAIDLAEPRYGRQPRMRDVMTPSLPALRVFHVDFTVFPLSGSVRNFGFTSR
ncbi:hypothetical protein [Xanthomonas bonasiae]|uniref:hypothetical protein n=1 Tax=Xanthomonas bonasiae TaxID=2810351 RepID=UPI001781A942|nr:hypothetical protein [Xanthomonas surreyensis]MBD7924770.1 hypothetical protein [Xanthomonas surreyensis]